MNLSDLMDVKLFSQALSKFLFGLIIISLLLFIPAGTLNYPHAWLFLALLFIPMFIAGIIMLIKSPQLLKRRLNDKTLGKFKTIKGMYFGIPV